MLKAFSQWLLYKHWGWKLDISVPIPNKYIICLAPHTSNWDFVIGQLYAHAEGKTTNFLMKREWFFWPLSVLFRKWGGIPVWRDKKTSMTDNLANAAKQADRFALCITPEGTRSLNPDWKKGFYYIALKANIPILLFGVDYKKKLIQCTKSLVPTGDIDSEMRQIKLYFKDFTGKIPKKFTIGDL